MIDGDIFAAVRVLDPTVPDHDRSAVYGVDSPEGARLTSRLGSQKSTRLRLDSDFHDDIVSSNSSHSSSKRSMASGMTYSSSQVDARRFRFGLAESGCKTSDAGRR